MNETHLGKYRGTVINNFDPMQLGRLQVQVPQLGQSHMGWALPCVPYAGFQVGVYFIPPIGANVWVEFEGGDINYPIWVGCFWSRGEKPELAVDPGVKLIQTQTATIMLNDTPGAGGITIATRDPAVEMPAAMRFDAAGIQFEVAPATVSMSADEGIKIVYPPNEASYTEEGISVNSRAAINVNSGDDLSLSADGAAEINAAEIVFVSNEVVKSPRPPTDGPAE